MEDTIPLESYLKRMSDAIDKGDLAELTKLMNGYVVDDVEAQLKPGTQPAKEVE